MKPITKAFERGSIGRNLTQQLPITQQVFQLVSVPESELDLCYLVYLEHSCEFYLRDAKLTIKVIMLDMSSVSVTHAINQ